MVGQRRKFGQQAIIIVDGPNRAGKTTIIEGLKEQFEFDVVFKGNATATGEEAELNTWNMLIQMINSKKNYLCDRFWYPTDTIYRPIMEGFPSVGLEDSAGGIRRLMSLMNVFFVFVVAEPPDLIARHKQLKEHWHMKDEQTLNRLGSAYLDLADLFPLPKSIVNTSIYNTPLLAIERAWRDIIYHYEVRSVNNNSTKIEPGKVVQLR